MPPFLFIISSKQAKLVSGLKRYIQKYVVFLDLNVLISFILIRHSSRLIFIRLYVLISFDVLHLEKKSAYD